MTAAALLSPVHPGEILEEEFLKPFHLSAYAAAAKMDVPRTRIERLVKGQTAITVDTARRLARLFRTTAQFWMNLQVAYDLQISASSLEEEIERIQPLEFA